MSSTEYDSVLEIIGTRLFDLRIARKESLGEVAKALKIKEKQVYESFYFISEGAFRHYQVYENGKETTLNLFMKNEWLFEYKSFMTQQPSKSFIQAVSDSELFGLTILDFYELIKFSETFFWPGSIFERATQNQECQHIRLSLEERYKRLLATQPGVLQYFRLKYIASYLGMEPETLSRVRKKVRPPYR